MIRRLIGLLSLLVALAGPAAGEEAVVFQEARLFPSPLRPEQPLLCRERESLETVGVARWLS